jgi:hypothetical protein
VNPSSYILYFHFEFKIMPLSDFHAGPRSQGCISLPNFVSEKGTFIPVLFPQGV